LLLVSANSQDFGLDRLRVRQHQWPFVEGGGKRSRACPLHSPSMEIRKPTRFLWGGCCPPKLPLDSAQGGKEMFTPVTSLFGTICKRLQVARYPFRDESVKLGSMFSDS